MVGMVSGSPPFSLQACHSSQADGYAWGVQFGVAGSTARTAAHTQGTSDRLSLLRGVVPGHTPSRRGHQPLELQGRLARVVGGVAGAC